MAINAEERKARIAAARNNSLRLMKMDANGTLDKLMEGRTDDINNSLMSDDANLTSESLMRTKRNTSSEGIPTGKMGVAAGNVTITASAEGYKTGSYDITVTAAG